jgi:hypothetical protein
LGVEESREDSKEFVLWVSFLFDQVGRYIRYIFKEAVYVRVYLEESDDLSIERSN